MYRPYIDGAVRWITAFVLLLLLQKYSKVVNDVAINSRDGKNRGLGWEQIRRMLSFFSSTGEFYLKWREWFSIKLDVGNSFTTFVPWKRVIIWIQ